MENKIKTYVGIGVVILLLVGFFFVGTMNGNATKNDDKYTNSQSEETYDEMMARMHPDRQAGSDSSARSLDLLKYRQSPIPVDCRLADYDNDIYAWVEHLGHHGNTQYCLEYFSDLK